MKTIRLRNKIILSVLFITAVFISLTAVFDRPLLFKSLTNKTYSSLYNISTEVQKLIPGDESYYFSIFSICNREKVNIEISDSEGYLIYTTEGNSAAGMNSFSYSGSTSSLFFSAPESKDYKIKNKNNFSVLTVSDKDYFVYWFTTDMGLCVYIYTPVAVTQEVVSLVTRVYSIFFIIFPIVMVAVILIIIFSFTKPVEDMKMITKKMADLDFSEKCKTHQNDEIGELGNNINELSNSLSKALEDLKIKNDELIQDIEQKKKLDNERKTFLSNVSHELKTPIAIISGYSEALMEGISTNPQTITEYCSIINSESSKMSDMVTELLELSRLENAKTVFNPTRFNISLIISNLIKSLSFESEKKSIEIVNLVPENTFVFGQPDKIEIVLKNYITNAIFHCENKDGEKKIVVSKKNNTFSVFNTGENIETEDIDFIWNGFYRADKSHNRKENRFGLGLAIVKSITDLHNEHCGVNNKKNGVEFWFTLKDISNEN